jgi:hypothetical protein
MDLAAVRALVDWAALGLPPGPLSPAAPLDDRDLEGLQSARASLLGGKPRDALTTIKPLLDDGKYDIRGLSVLLQAVAVERPVVGAAAALDRLAGLLDADWEALGPSPEDRRRKLANVAFPAMLDELRVALTIAGTSGPVVDAWEALCQAVQEGARTRGLDGVVAKMAEVRAACPSPPKPPPPEAQPAPEPQPASSPPLALRPSPAFLQLLDRLRAFETLLARHENDKAAIVAQDIEATIAQFDPRLYFPELFSGFFAGLAEHAAELAAFQGEQDSMAWRAMGQLYRVDLEAFLRARGRR